MCRKPLTLDETLKLFGADVCVPLAVSGGNPLDMAALALSMAERLHERSVKDQDVE